MHFDAGHLYLFVNFQPVNEIPRNINTAHYNLYNKYEITLIRSGFDYAKRFFAARSGRVYIKRVLNMSNAYKISCKITDV